MNVTTTFRHMEQSEALKAYAEEKLERVKKYIDGPISAQVFFTVEKIRHIVEIVISAKRGEHQGLRGHQRHVCGRGRGD